nr:hypothetical protein [Brevundimonas denitrificans]
MLALLAAITAILPLIGVVAAALSGGGADIAARDVTRYALTSAALALMVAVLTGVSGSIAAWLVVMHRFPGGTCSPGPWPCHWPPPLSRWPTPTPTCSTWRAICACGCGPPWASTCPSRCGPCTARPLY